MSYIESKNTEFKEIYKKNYQTNQKIQSLNNIDWKLGFAAQTKSEVMNGQKKKKRIFDDDQKIVSLQTITSYEEQPRIIMDPIKQMNELEEIKQIV